jgi:hypothetical protein
MMSKYVLCIVAVFAFLAPAFGQSPAPNGQTAADSKAQQELNRKVQVLLAETAQQAAELKNRENQILVRVAVADLLWKDQEKSARGLYQETFDSVCQALAGIDQSEPESFESYDALSRLRDQLLESLGRHDPTMARDLFRKSRLPARPDSANADTLPADAPAPRSDRSDDDTRLELSLATEMVDQDPKEAVRIAREALSTGYPSEIVSLLLRLAQKEPKMASELAVEIVNKLRKEKLDSNPEAVGIAVFLVGEATSAAKAAKEEGQTEGRAPLLDPQLAREFIEFVADAALKKQSGQSGGFLLMNLRSLVNEMEESAPAQAARLKQTFSEMEKENEDTNAYSRFQKVSQTNDTGAMLELARSAPREMRDSLYSQAASSAWQQGDKAKANEIVTRNISNPLERNRLLLSFHEQTISESVQKEDFVQARRLIAQTRSIEGRLGQLIDLADALTKKNDKKAALEILEEAHTLMPGKATKESELELQMRLAGAFSRLDPDRSFALISSAIDQINDLMDAAARVANFIPSPVTMKDNEFAIDSYNRVPFGLGILSSRDIRTLGQADFDKTRKMFDRFQRPEMRVAAYLFMSQSVLEPEAPDDCTCQEQLKKLKSGSPNK